MVSYLSAYFDDALPEQALELVAGARPPTPPTACTAHCLPHLAALTFPAERGPHNALTT